MADKTVKSYVNDVVFFCAFKTEKTIKTESETIYTLIDNNSDFKFKCVLTSPDEDNEQHLVVLHQGLKDVSELNIKRFNKVIEKFQKIPNLTVLIEDMSDNELSDELEDKINKLCDEYGVTTEGED